MPYCDQCEKQLPGEGDICPDCQPNRQTPQSTPQEPMHQGASPDGIATRINESIRTIEAFPIKNYSEEQFVQVSNQLNARMEQAALYQDQKQFAQRTISPEQTHLVNVIAMKTNEAEQQFGRPLGNPEIYERLGNVAQLMGHEKSATGFYEKAFTVYEHERSQTGTGNENQGAHEQSFGETVSGLFESMEGVDTSELEFTLKKTPPRPEPRAQKTTGSIVRSQTDHSNVAQSGGTIIDKRTMINIDPRKQISFSPDWLMKEGVLPSRRGFMGPRKELVCKQFPAFLRYERGKLDTILESKGLCEASPGIVPFSGIREIDGSLYLVREFVRGTPLDHYVQHPEEWAKYDFSIMAFLTIITKTCRSLKFKRGLHHGALHTRNIIYTPAKEPVMTDFGMNLIKYLVDTEHAWRAGTGTVTTDTAPDQHLAPASDIRQLGTIIARFMACQKIQKQKINTQEKNILTKLTHIQKGIASERLKTIS